jgi:molybdopterin-binding protein
MTPAGIVVEGIHKSFRGRRVVDVDRLEIRPGRTLALLGPSGSGKSTLLSIVGLLEKPDAGRVLLDGVAVTPRDTEARMSMAAAFQRPYLFKGTVADNIAYGLRLRRASQEQVASRVSQALGRVGLPGWETRSALTLSGGEAQRVALARAIVLEPRVLLLDEPLASLDPIIKWRLARDFASILRESDITTVYVTHDQDEALTVADDVAVIREGRIVAQGLADDIFGLPADDWTAAFLGMEPPLSGTVQEVRDGVARVECDGTAIYAVSQARPGSHVLVGVRPEDVTLFAGDQELPASSARNRLTGTVSDVEHSGSTYRVVLAVGALRIASRLSRAAVTELGLAPGVTVTAAFKATAVRVRAIEPAEIEAGYDGTPASGSAIRSTGDLRA